MKLKLLFICLLLFTVTANSQLLQKNFEISQGDLINANLAEVDDGTNDVVIGGNLKATASAVPILKRVKEDGTLLWSKTYSVPAFNANARFFDIENYFDLIFVTGSIDVNNVKKVFLLKIEAQTGDILGTQYYDIITSSFNSVGFNVIITESDATGDSNPNPGLLVTGFFGNCPNADSSCSMNIGFALRTDLNLNTIWTIEVDSTTPGLDYDFVNGAVETSDGFVLTGSATGQGNSNVQAGVLIHKINFQGGFEWDSSYIFGNSTDVSVDAYYDSGTNEIFLLNNYSNQHHFGVTVVDNTNGTIDGSRSWHVNEVSSSLDYYGFSLVESLSSSGNLVVYGYRRNYFDGTDNNESNILVYEFNKATGNQVGTSYQYLTPYQETHVDEYNFWNGQLPLIYFPDMALYDSSATTPIHYVVGYRNGASATGGYSNIEFMNIDAQKENACDNIVVDYNRTLLGSLNSLSNISSGTVSTSDMAVTFDNTVITMTEESCSAALSTEELQKSDIKLYPNPASDYVFINNAEIKSIQVMDITGKKVLDTTSYSKDEGIYIGNLEKGIYFINVETLDQSSSTVKLIKN